MAQRLKSYISLCSHFEHSLWLFLSCSAYVPLTSTIFLEMRPPPSSATGAITTNSTETARINCSPCQGSCQVRSSPHPIDSAGAPRCHALSASLDSISPEAQPVVPPDLNMIIKSASIAIWELSSALGDCRYNDRDCRGFGEEGGLVPSPLDHFHSITADKERCWLQYKEWLLQTVRLSSSYQPIYHLP